MPKGPQGQKRPADAIGRAIMVAKIATGEIEDTAAIWQEQKENIQALGATYRNPAAFASLRSAHQR